MTISPWRWAHLWLAIISGIFLFIASVTGAILSTEPIYEGSKGYKVAGGDELTIAELTDNLISRYPELLSISRDPNGFIQAQIFVENGEASLYINPFTGEAIGKPFDTPAIFDFSRTLHRSLFIGKFGRFLVGFASLLLMIIAFSGIVLIAKKQGGLTRYFKKLVGEDFYRDWHTQLGKIMVFTIIAISATGTYLFGERFELVPVATKDHVYDSETLSTTPVLSPASFPVLRNHHVNELKELIFPFSDYVEDFFELKLTDRELLINQLTGEIASERRYTSTKQLSLLAFSWHTAEGQPWWAALLGSSSISLLFFLFTGFKIYLNRSKIRPEIKNPISKENAQIVIGYGSEMGSTLRFAKAFHEALLHEKQSSYLTSLNEFEYLPEMKYLLVFTSTYGTGGPPSNASQFLKCIQKTEYASPFSFAVLGFGSTKYHDYCQYAMEVDKVLSKLVLAKRLLPLKTVDNAAINDFNQWVLDYNKVNEFDLSVKSDQEPTSTISLKVAMHKFSPNVHDETFLLYLDAHKKHLRPYQSGDLLVIKPEHDPVARYYSMSVNHKMQRVTLSVKRHEQGMVSKHLSQLKANDMLNTSFKKNESFHFPKRAKQVIMIANGTGIAPFLGMIAENTQKVSITLFWGGQNDASYQLYRSDLMYWIEKGQLREVKTAFSRVDENPMYVQNLLRMDRSLLIQCLAEENTIMICGGLKMKESVDQLLDDLAHKHFNRPLSYYYERELIKEDCY